MVNIFEKINYYLTKFSASLSFAGAIWIFLIMGVIVVDVSGRYLFNSPLTGTPEIVSNSIVGIAFFMIPWATAKDSHIRVTIIVDSVSAKWKRILDITSYLLGLFVFIQIANSGWRLLITAWTLFEYEGEGALRVPTYPIRTAIFIGSILSAWHIFYKLIHKFLPIISKKLLKGGE